jgi:hypothetical protein
VLWLSLPRRGPSARPRLFFCLLFFACCRNTAVRDLIMRMVPHHQHQPVCINCAIDWNFALAGIALTFSLLPFLLKGSVMDGGVVVQADFDVVSLHRVCFCMFDDTPFLLYFTPNACCVFSPSLSSIRVRVSLQWFDIANLLGHAWSVCTFFFLTKGWPGKCLE